MGNAIAGAQGLAHSPIVWVILVGLIVGSIYERWALRELRKRDQQR